MAKKKAEGTMTKTAAVQAAIQEGADKPAAGVALIKEKFGIDITNQQFSTLKSLANKKGGSAGKKRGRPAGSKNGGSDGVGISPAELARHVKALVEKHGAASVQEMVKVFE